MIVKRIYTYAAPKFNFFFKRWKINQKHFESIWTFFKILISDYSYFLTDYTLDYFIVLSLFMTLYLTEDISDLFNNESPGKKILIYFLPLNLFF